MKPCEQPECPYYDSRVYIPSDGNRLTDILIVGEAPAFEEVANGRPFIGRSGKVLHKLLNSIGLDRDDVRITNAVRCQILKDTDTVSVIGKAMKCCRHLVEDEIRQTEPRLVILLGGVALRQVLRLQKPMENRGKFFQSEEFGCTVFSTVHPAFVLRGSSKNFPDIPLNLMSMRERLIFLDFKQVKEFFTNGNVVPQIQTLNYTLGTLEDLKEIGNSPVVAFDFETTMGSILNGSRVLSISFSHKEGESRVFIIKKGLFNGNRRVHEKVVSICTDPKIKKIVAARPFEEQLIRHALKAEPQGAYHDVLTMAHILDENFHSYSLESVVNHYTTLRNIKDVAEGMRLDLENASDTLLIKYNGVDSDATLRAYNAMKVKFGEDKKLLRYYLNFTLPVQTMLSDITSNGVLIDMDKLEEREEEARVHLDNLHTVAIGLIPLKIRKEHEDKGLKLSRAQLLSDFLFKNKAGLKLKPQMYTDKTKNSEVKEPQTSEAHLKLFKSKPFVSTVLQWKKGEKIRNTYFPAIRKALKADGRIYPQTILTRTVTGRTVMLDPPIQTIPQRGAFANWIRDAIVADYGWVFGGRDLAQSELRIIGWLAKDKNILSALEEGVDLHSKTAAVVNNVPVAQVTPEMRQQAKPINFGFCYGAQAQTFKDYAKEKYDITFSLKESEDIRNAFFSKPNGYYMLPVYHNLMIHHAQTHGYVESRLGRKRRLPSINSPNPSERSEAMRQAINFPVQSFSSDLGLIGMLLARERIRERGLDDRIKILWFIHDFVLFMAKDDYLQTGMEILKDCMETQTKKYIKEKFKVDIGYPIESDGKYGISWGSMKKYKED